MVKWEVGRNILATEAIGPSKYLQVVMGERGDEGRYPGCEPL